MGATRDRRSLEQWRRRFDVESPKGSIDGSQVSRVTRAERIEDIGEHCLRDVSATAQLYPRAPGCGDPDSDGRTAPAPLPKAGHASFRDATKRAEARGRRLFEDLPPRAAAPADNLKRHSPSSDTRRDEPSRRP